MGACAEARERHQQCENHTTAARSPPPLPLRGNRTDVWRSSRMVLSHTGSQVDRPVVRTGISDTTLRTCTDREHVVVGGVLERGRKAFDETGPAKWAGRGTPSAYRDGPGVVVSGERLASRWQTKTSEVLNHVACGLLSKTHPRHPPGERPQQATLSSKLLLSMESEGRRTVVMSVFNISWCGSVTMSSMSSNVSTGSSVQGQQRGACKNYENETHPLWSSREVRS